MRAIGPRSIVRFCAGIPGREQIPCEEDERVPLRLMDLREGAVGASATGEAYYNFGSVGPFIFFACVGALFGWLERRGGRTPYHCALLGIVMSLFYFNIRSLALRSRTIGVAWRYWASATCSAGWFCLRSERLTMCGIVGLVGSMLPLERSRTLVSAMADAHPAPRTGWRRRRRPS